MKKLKVSLINYIVYDSYIDVPEHMNLDEAIDYSKEHLNKILLSKMDRIDDWFEIDEEYCEFEE